MKKYAPLFIAITVVIILIVSLLLYRKKLLKERLESMANFDNYDTAPTKGQQIKIKQNSLLNQVFDNGGYLAVNGQFTVKTTDKLTYVGKYNDLNLIKRKGWFFDRYFLIKNDLIV